MALTDYQVKEGYAFFHLDKSGNRLKRTPAGGIVQLVGKDQFEQSWKLEEVKPLSPDAPERITPEDDLDLITLYKGNKKLAELFEEKTITSYSQVVDMNPDDLAPCFKGNKDEKGAQVKKLLESAYSLAGLG